MAMFPCDQRGKACCSDRPVVPGRCRPGRPHISNSCDHTVRDSSTPTLPSSRRKAARSRAAVITGSAFQGLPVYFGPNFISSSSLWNLPAESLAARLQPRQGDAGTGTRRRPFPAGTMAERTVPHAHPMSAEYEFANPSKIYDQNFGEGAALHHLREKKKSQVQESRGQVRRDQEAKR
ncbi:uncharacterized protein LOC123036858 isoform X3 [Varanus komodoensis]|uniref:uncharacterized protein LOC123036858 isoform X3 n=1 Tax=Varanus komodoensis TaxID=61221 RepID=UPI001CF77B92|nr:uncharacterized protein LOC123036858 isoform X3 [Varanus komodoensis]